MGGYVKVILSEEFSFENINNLTSAKGLKIFNGDFVAKEKVRESFIYVIRSLKQDLVWDEKI